MEHTIKLSTTLVKVTANVIKKLYLINAVVSKDSPTVILAYFSEKPHCMFNRVKPAIHTSNGLELIKVGDLIVYEKDNAFPLCVIRKEDIHLLIEEKQLKLLK